MVLDISPSSSIGLIICSLKYFSLLSSQNPYISALNRGALQYSRSRGNSSGLSLTLVLAPVLASVLASVVIVSKLVPMLDDYKSGSIKHLPNIKATDRMSGEQFEQYCAAILDLNGFQHILLTTRKGDHGVDILAWKFQKKYAFQCKCYTGNVGNHALHVVFSGKTIYTASENIVMKNSYYTKQAMEDAIDLHVILCDRDKLQHMIDLANGVIK